MASQREIADFFKPYAKAIPAKRASPCSDDQSTDAATARKPQHANPRTPATTTRFKDVNDSPFRSPLLPRSSGSVSIPIRPSPRSKPCTQTQISTTSTRLSPRLKGPLFKSKDTQTDPIQSSASPFLFENTPNSAKRVDKNGEVVAVKGSDDEDESDTDSLYDLEDILRGTEQAPSTSSSSPPDPIDPDLEAMRRKSLFLFTNGRSVPLIGRDKLRELNSKATSYKFDITALIEDHCDDAEAEDNVAKAKHGYAATRHEKERLHSQSELDRNLLASIVRRTDNDEGDMSRLLNAVERTEAFSSNKTWRFFVFRENQESHRSPPEFPIQHVGPDSWYSCMNDHGSRERAFLSGYVTEMWATSETPVSLVDWAFGNVISEPREDVRKAYIAALKQASCWWTADHVTSSNVQDVFLRLGACKEAVQCFSSVEPVMHFPSEPQFVEPSHLLSAINMFVAICPDLGPSVFETFACLLARMAIDTNLMNDCRISVVIESALSTVMELQGQKANTDVARALMDDVGQNVHDPYLQAQLLKNIHPTSPIAAKVRIQLARRFLLGSEAGVDWYSDSMSTISLPELTKHLHSPMYDATCRSSKAAPFDYSVLKSRAEILDIAISDGGRPSTFPSRADESTFNHQVDVLADRVKSILGSIADSGASHMRRTEAKEALQMLHFRLLYAVRTKPRPRKSVFGGQDGETFRIQQRSQGIMQKFLARKKEKGMEGSKESRGSSSSGGSSKLPKSE